MPRMLKPHKVEAIADRDTGEITTLYFDRNKKDFFCTVGVEEFRDPTVDGLRVKARAALKAFKPYEWKTYIFLNAERDNTIYYGGRHTVQHIRAKIELSLWRHEVAERQDGQLLLRPVIDKEGFTDPDRFHEFDEHDTAEDRQAWMDRCVQDNRKCRKTGEDIEQVYFKHKLKDLADTVLPYTDESWVALLAVRQRIIDAATLLEEVTKAPDFVKKLRLVAANLKLLPEKL